MSTEADKIRLTAKCVAMVSVDCQSSLDDVIGQDSQITYKWCLSLLPADLFPLVYS